MTNGVQKTTEELMLYGGSGTSVASGLLSLNQVGIIVGITTAFIGLYFSWRRHKREQVLFQLEKRKLKNPDV